MAINVTHDAFYEDLKSAYNGAIKSPGYDMGVKHIKKDWYQSLDLKRTRT